MKMVNILNKRNSVLYFVLSVCFTIVCCSKNNNQRSDNSNDRQQENVNITKNKEFIKTAWITADSTKTDAYYNTLFKKCMNNGISEVLVNTNANTDLLNKVIKASDKTGVKIHAWIMSVNRPGDDEAQKHPEWYAVSRNGKSCYDEPPYVDYYKWMCPTRKESRAHILKLVKRLAEVPNIKSVHLDYIRYCDVFLPIGLLPKYNLVQDKELPEYDFCYCEVCINKFESIHHKNPLKMTNTELDIEWKNFRLNQIRNLVNDAYNIVHEKGKEMTAAVFPYPEMAGKMVRQRWDKWDINSVYPMLYHNFYNEEIDWIGYATRQCKEDLEGKNVDLYPGIYVIDLSPKDLKTAIDQVKNNGGNGVAFFELEAITEKQWDIINKYEK